MKKSADRNKEFLQNSIFKFLSKVKLKLQPKESLNLWTVSSQHLEILKYNRPKYQHHCNHDDCLCHYHRYNQRTCECECDDRMFGEKRRRCEADPAAYWDTGLVWMYMLILIVVMFLRKKKKARLVFLFLLQFLFMYEQKRCTKRNRLPTGHQRKYQHHLECNCQQAISSS